MTRTQELVLTIAVAAAMTVAIKLAGTPFHFRLDSFDAEDMRQGKLISDAIKGHDSSIVTRFQSDEGLISYGYGGPIIKIGGVIDTGRQDAVLSWIRELQQQRIVTRQVRVLFYERGRVIHPDPIRRPTITFTQITGNVLRDVTVKT